jgi:hypothetical protein
MIGIKIAISYIKGALIMKDIIPIESIESKIYLIRGQKVMLDRGLAKLYGVETFNLNKAVKRNVKRFPEDFMFQLTRIEYNVLRFQIGTIEKASNFTGKDERNLKFQTGMSSLKSQIVISSFSTAKAEWGGRRTRPYAFTEQGVAMLSSVLRSERAIMVNIAIMRAFVQLKQTLAIHKELADKFKELESRVNGHDTDIKIIVEEIKRIIEIEQKPKPRIGFVTKSRD